MKHDYACSFTYRLWLSSHYDNDVDLSQERPHGSRSLRSLLAALYSQSLPTPTLMADWGQDLRDYLVPIRMICDSSWPLCTGAAHWPNYEDDKSICWNNSFPLHRRVKKILVQRKKMLEYFLIFPDRKNEGEPNCYLEDYKCHIVITDAHCTTQWHTHVHQTWHLPWLHCSGFHHRLDSRAWALKVKPGKLSCHCLFTCQSRLDSCLSWDLTPKQYIWHGCSFHPFLSEFEKQQRIYDYN